MSSFKRSVFTVCFGILANVLASHNIALADTSKLALSLHDIPVATTGQQVIPSQPSREIPEQKIKSGIREITEFQANRNAFGFSCDHSISVTPQSGAMIDLNIDAPCKRSQRVLIDHAGVGFHIRLSDTGTANVSVPLLAVSGEIDTIFENFSHSSHSYELPEIEAIARVSVQWSRAGIAEMTSVSPTIGNRRVYRFGDGSGQVIDVFSRPVSRQNGPIVDRLIIRSDVDENNCDQAREAKVRQVLPNQPMVKYDLSIAAPGCLRIGTSMVLKNVLQDLKLAVD